MNGLNSIFCIIRHFKRKNLNFNIPLTVISCMPIYTKTAPAITVGTACKKMKKLVFKWPFISW